MILITTVLPAEYGIDPTGMGAHLGLDALQPDADPSAPEETAATTVAASAPATSTPDNDVNAALAAKAKAAFGENEGQSLDAAAFSASAGELRSDTYSGGLLNPARALK